MINTLGRRNRPLRLEDLLIESTFFSRNETSSWLNSEVECSLIESRRRLLTVVSSSIDSIELSKSSHSMQEIEDKLHLLFKTEAANSGVEGIEDENIEDEQEVVVLKFSSPSKNEGTGFLLNLFAKFETLGVEVSTLVELSVSSDSSASVLRCVVSSNCTSNRG